MCPYKLQLVQKLKRGDKTKRRAFCQWFVPPCLGGQWAEVENLEHGVVEEAVQFAPSVTVWCAVSAKAIVGPYFFLKRTGAL
jgi:hypothetical protein